MNGQKRSSVLGKRAQVLSIYLLASGILVAAAGLVGTFISSPGFTSFFFILMVVGIVDGLLGLVLASITILWGAPRGSCATGESSCEGEKRIDRGIVCRGEEPVDLERDRARMGQMLLAVSVLSIVFLGILSAIAFRIPLLLKLMRGKLVP